MRTYENSQLNAFAQDAFARGEDFFCARPKDPQNLSEGFELCDYDYKAYFVDLTIDKDIYEQWFLGSFTKTICEAKNRNQLLKATSIAEELGLVENDDYFLIKDNCLTELKPEEVGDDGVGRTLTCIGFKPLPDDLAHQISRKYQLYR